MVRELKYMRTHAFFDVHLRNNAVAYVILIAIYVFSMNNALDKFTIII